jgi:N-ethylmaleimide reductase
MVSFLPFDRILRIYSFECSGLVDRRCTPTSDPFDETNTIPNDDMVEYYSQRASAGLLITEATAISERGCGWLNAAHIYTPAQVEGWKKVTEKVHAADGIIYLQLWHMGRQSHSSYHATGKIMAPSPIAAAGQATTNTGEKVPYEVPVEMTVDEIQSTIQEYVHAAKMAKEAGFDGVELHGANGYLIDEFLQSSTNQRSDAYGGSMENRVRFLEEVLAALIDSGAYPVNRIGVRLSPNGNYGGMGSVDNDVMFPFVAKTLNKYGLAYLHVMDGLGFGFHEKCPAVTMFDMKKQFDSAPLICNIGLTKDTAEGMIRSGTADLCCFGRLYISNPDLPERFANDWPVAEPAPYETWWYATGAKGYTDWPTYQPVEKESEDA